jgi:hypothetical protein
MNRRGFLGALLGVAVLDPEKLLWVPGQKLISIPSATVLEPTYRNGILAFQLASPFKQEIIQDIATIPAVLSSKIWYDGRGYVANVTAVRLKPLGPSWAPTRVYESLYPIQPVE